MTYLFLIICSLILSPFSASKLTINKPHLCIDCKFFEKDLISNKYGKCSLFTTEDDNKSFLVDGIDRTRIEYQYCAIARKYDDMCGEEGKFYVKNRGIKK
jgi:hypothetical protein